MKILDLWTSPAMTQVSLGLLAAGGYLGPSLLRQAPATPCAAEAKACVKHDAAVCCA